MGKDDPSKLHREECRRLRFISRNLLSNLATGEKMYVRRGEASATLDQIRPLHAALQSFGPNVLLWVVQADRDHVAGSVKEIEAGLLKAYVSDIGLLAPFPNWVFDEWLEICARACLLAWGEIRAREEPRPDLLSLHGDPSSGPPLCNLGAQVAEANSVPALRPGISVYRHTLTRAACGEAWYWPVRAGMPVGKTCTVSMWIWIPAAFTGRVLSPSFVGRPTLNYAAAALTLRDQWQRIWCSARVPEDSCDAFAALYIFANGGDEFYSTCWVVEEGTYPTRYIPMAERPTARNAAVLRDPRINLLPHPDSGICGAWRTEAGSAIERLSVFDGYHHDADVLKLTTIGPVADTVMHHEIDTEFLVPGESYTLSCMLWIPADFAGTEATPVFHGRPSVDITWPNFTVRERWQRVAATCICPDAPAGLLAGLFVKSGDRASLLTTCWKVERGATATRYEPQRPSLLPPDLKLEPPAWQNLNGALVHPTLELPPRFSARQVLRHELTASTMQGSNLAHTIQLRNVLSSSDDHVMSLWAWVPWAFTGTHISVRVDHWGYQTLVPASLAAGKRGLWQWVWCRIRPPPGACDPCISLVVLGNPGDVFYTTAWKLEQGEVPTRDQSHF